MELKFKELNQALDNYLSVHDAIFKQRIGQASDYESLKEYLASARKDLHECRVYFSEATGISADQRDVILCYITCVERTLEDLTKIVSGLESVAMGMGSYGFFKYRRDLKTYRESSRLHMEYGPELNRIYSEVTISNNV